jgi:hypothetical protein
MNRAIIINSFGRGGSNILSNMIASSPAVLVAASEFWQFYYNGFNISPKIYRRLGTKAGRFASRSLFCADRFRKRLGRSIQESVFIDYQLRKQRGLDLTLAKWSLFKVTEYDIFLNSKIEKQFDDSVFIGLVRNGYGLCESWKRRGMPAKMAGRIYGDIVAQMIAGVKSKDNYLLVRFEDMLLDPLRFLDQLYERLALPLPRDDAYIHRPKGYGPGQESAASGRRTMRIVPRSYWESLVAKDINAAAIRRLTRQDLSDFNQHGAGAMEQLYELRDS